MNFIVVLCVFISLSVAAPILEDAQARTLDYKNENDGLGNYEFSFETSNGISRREYGRLVNVGEPDEHLVVQGSYSYSDTNGKLVVVNYTADENGYRIDEGLQGFQLEYPQPVVVSALPPAAVATLLG